MSAEPELEELSAYVDQELTGTARQELEAHLETCETCRRRLDALRQTVSAVKALPMEAPPRAFTVPPMRQQRSTGPGWAWAGGALAAACLVVVVTVALTHIPQRGAGGASTATLSQLYSPNHAAQDRNTQAAPAAGLALGGNSQTVTDPQNGSIQLALATAGRTYGASGSLQVNLILQGVSGQTAPTNLADAGISLSLQRDGYGVSLQNPGSFSATREGDRLRITAVYRLSDLSFPRGAPGDYALVGAWQVPGQSGTSLILIAQVPLTITP